MKLKRDWAGHILRMQPDWWTKAITLWIPAEGR